MTRHHKIKRTARHMGTERLEEFNRSLTDWDDLHQFVSLTKRFEDED